MKEESLEFWEKERKDALFLRGELLDLKYWLEEGYKEEDAKRVVINFITDEADRLYKKAQFCMESIIEYKKKNEK